MMITYKTIVCAIDLGVDEDKHVLEMGGMLAKVHRARLVVVYVVDSPLLTLSAGSGPLKLPEDEAEAVGRAAVSLKKQAQAQLKIMVANLSPMAAIEVLEGPPIAPRIVEVMERHAADLLVIGSHGRGRIRRLLVGSVCDRLLRTSPASVLVVKRRSESETTIS